MELKPEVRRKRKRPTGFWLRLAAMSFVIKLLLVAGVFWLLHAAANAGKDDEARQNATDTPHETNR